MVGRFVSGGLPSRVRERGCYLGFLMGGKILWALRFGVCVSVCVFSLYL